MKVQKRNKNIIIIGAGMSGLSAGIYALDNGFDVTIYEKNPEAGGLCTGWFRDGRYIDGCIHWLTGTKRGTELYNMWTHLGAFQDENDLIYLPSFFTSYYYGTKVHFYADLEKTREEMTRISPQDKYVIDLFIHDVKAIMKLDLPLDSAMDQMSFLRLWQIGIKTLPIVPKLMMTSTLTRKDYSRQFKHPALRYAFENCIHGDNNFFTFLYSYAGFIQGNCALPKGGSLKMVSNMVNKFKSLGGKLILNKPVKEIVVRNKKAIGVEFNDGTKDFANYIIPACDIPYTLKYLLKNKYYDWAISSRFKKYDINKTPSCVQVSLKIEGDVSYIETPIEYPIHCIKVGVSEVRNINVRNYNYEAELYTRENATLIGVLIDQYKDDFLYWYDLKKRSISEYHKEKERIADEVVKALENHYPDLKGKITVIDTFTPSTLNRYCNATYGAYMPFSYSNKNTLLFHNQKVRGVSNLYLASQWTQTPGGLPLAIVSGKFAIQKILYKEINLFDLVKRLRIFFHNKFRKKALIQ